MIGNITGLPVQFVVDWKNGQPPFTGYLTTTTEINWSASDVRLNFSYLTYYLVTSCAIHRNHIYHILDLVSSVQ